MELLSSLESTVANLNSKSCTVLDTLENAILGARAALYGFIPDTTGTDTCIECGNDAPAEGQKYCLDCLESTL